MTSRIVQVETHKQSDFYGIEKPWFNRWYFSIPFELKHYDFNRFVTELVRLEAQFHHNHVRFTSVSGIHWESIGDHTEDNARVNSPFNGNIRGVHGNPPDIAPFHWCKRVKFSVLKGNIGLKWFRGGLSLQDAQVMTNGRYRMIYRDFWQTQVSNWIYNLHTQYGAYMVIPQGVNKYGSPHSFQDVLAVTVEGITLAKDNARAAAKVTGNGKSIFEALQLTAETLEEYRNFLYDVIEFNNDFGPGQKIKDDFTTVIGDVKAMLGRAEGYANGVQQDIPETAEVAFRFGPSAEQIATLCSANNEKVTQDIETVTNIPLYPLEGSQQYMHKSDTQDVFDLVDKYTSAIAHLLAVDWRNPANTH